MTVLDFLKTNSSLETGTVLEFITSLSGTETVIKYISSERINIEMQSNLFEVEFKKIPKIEFNLQELKFEVELSQLDSEE